LSRLVTKPGARVLGALVREAVVQGANVLPSALMPGLVLVLVQL